MAYCSRAIMVSHLPPVSCALNFPRKKDENRRSRVVGAELRRSDCETIAEGTKVKAD